MMYSIDGILQTYFKFMEHNKIKEKMKWQN